MPRPYHSPSSLALGDPEKGCEAAWAWQYIAGFRPPQLTWDEILAGAVPARGQRAPALGGAVHETGEAYYDGKEPQYGWGSLPGQIYASGIPYLPHPARCDEVMVEQPVGTEPSGLEPGPRVLPTVLVVGGTRFGGFFDLGVNSEEEVQRLLKGKAVSPYMVVDYKSTSSITKWGKSRETLLQDPQVCLYGLNMMQRYKLEAVDCRWLYMETGPTRKAKPVDICVERSHAERVLTALAPIARRLDLITDPLQAATNLDRCEDYGGRPCHFSRGGPCQARRSLGALIQKKQLVRSDTEMAVNPAVRANFEIAAKEKVAAIVAPVVEASGGAGGSTSPGGVTIDAQTGVVVDNVAKTIAPVTPRPRRPGRPKPPEAKVNEPEADQGTPGDASAMEQLALPFNEAPPLQTEATTSAAPKDAASMIAELATQLRQMQRALDVAREDVLLGEKSVAEIKAQIKELCDG